MTHITHIMGGWSPNIGNAFFELGGYHLLQTVLPEATFSLINEKPGYPQYWNPRGGNPHDYFDMAAAVQSDYLVLVGAIFRPEMMKIWGESLDKIVSRGTRLIMLGVGGTIYGAEDIVGYRNFVKRYSPYILVSRDHETYEKLGEFAQHAYDGFDMAFFVPDYYPVYGFKNLPPYVAYAFDEFPEPEISIVPPGKQPPDPRTISQSFEFNNQTWVVKLLGWRTRMALRSRYLMFAEGILFRGEQNKEIGQYPIIRTNHRYTPTIGRKTFRSPNMMVNDTPHPYFEIYGNAELVLTNRLHATIISLAYGRPAMVISQSPRLKMFERFNLADITRCPTRLDKAVLDQEKAKLKAFLKEYIV